jgi:hypothetical protein
MDPGIRRDDVGVDSYVRPPIARTRIDPDISAIKYGDIS